jgi:hypothetical protein
MAHEINLLQETNGLAVPGLSLRVVALAPLAMGVLFAAAAVLLAWQASRLERHVAQLEAAAHPAAPAAALPDSGLAGLEHTLAVRAATLELLRSAAAADRSGFAGDFHALSRQVIEGVWLTGVRLERSATFVQGRALSPQRISAYLAGLRSETSFAEHAFDTIALRTPEEVAGVAPSLPGVEFTLSSRPAIVASGTGAAQEPR